MLCHAIWRSAFNAKPEPVEGPLLDSPASQSNLSLAAFGMVANVLDCCATALSVEPHIVVASCCSSRERRWTVLRDAALEGTVP